MVRRADDLALHTQAVQSTMKPQEEVPYHNATHVSDVLHGGEPAAQNALPVLVVLLCCRRRCCRHLSTIGQTAQSLFWTAHRVMSFCLRSLVVPRGSGPCRTHDTAGPRTLPPPSACCAAVPPRVCSHGRGLAGLVCVAHSGDRSRLRSPRTEQRLVSARLALHESWRRPHTHPPARRSCGRDSTPWPTAEQLSSPPPPQHSQVGQD